MFVKINKQGLVSWVTERGQGSRRGPLGVWVRPGPVAEPHCGVVGAGPVCPLDICLLSRSEPC